MKTINKYICETCGTAYKYEITARYCEQLAPKLKPCPVTVGQKVWVYDRYGYGIMAHERCSEEYDTDVILKITLVSTGLPKLVEENRTEEETTAFLNSYKEDKDKLKSHCWQLTMKERHQLGKDYYSEELGLSEIEIDGHWLKTEGKEDHFLDDEYE